MTLATDARAWPIRVIAIEAGRSSVKGRPAEFRHAGIALRTHRCGMDALLDLGHEPQSVILVPTDLTDMPLLQFVELAVSVAHAPVLIGLAPGVGAGVAKDCLNLGARGVVPLPVTPQQLAQAITGITPPQTDEPTITVGHLTLDRGGHRVQYFGQDVVLALKEFALLEHLMDVSPNVATMPALIGRFGYPRRAEQAMPIHAGIRRLRVKLGAVAPSGAPAVIETIRGVGYRIAT